MIYLQAKPDGAAGVDCEEEGGGRETDCATEYVEEVARAYEHFFSGMRRRICWWWIRCRRLILWSV